MGVDVLASTAAWDQLGAGGLVRVASPAWCLLSVLEGFLHEGRERGEAPGDPSGSLKDS